MNTHQLQVLALAESRVPHLQSAEFEAAATFSVAARRLYMTPPTTDEYPAARYDYEQAIEALLRAAKANGRATP